MSDQQERTNAEPYFPDPYTRIAYTRIGWLHDRIAELEAQRDKLREAGELLHKCAEALIEQADPEWDGGSVGYLVNELGVASASWAEALSGGEQE